MKTEFQSFGKVKIGQYTSIENLIDVWKSKRFPAEKEINWCSVEFMLEISRGFDLCEFERVKLSDKEREVDLFFATGEEIVLEYEKKTGDVFEKERVSDSQIEKLLKKLGYCPCNTEMMISYLFDNFQKKSRHWYDFVCDGDGPVRLHIRPGKNCFQIRPSLSKEVNLSKRWIFTK